MHVYETGKKVKVEDSQETLKTPWNLNRPSISPALATGKQVVEKSVPALPHRRSLTEWMEHKLEEFKKKMPIDEKVEAIMKNKPIRERLDLSFLPRESQLGLPRGYRNLLSKMEFIDRTLEFYTAHRQKRGLTFEKLRENLLHEKQFIEMSDIKRLMFVSEECY